MIFGLSSRSHCAPYASLAHILFLPDVINLVLSILGYKVFHNFRVPHSVYCLFHRVEHKYLTRAVNFNFFVPQSRLNTFHNGPVLSCIRVWNELSTLVKNSMSLYAFKSIITSNSFCAYV